jgi:hypothetical protein
MVEWWLQEQWSKWVAVKVSHLDEMHPELVPLELVKPLDSSHGPAAHQGHSRSRVEGMQGSTAAHRDED